MGLYGEFQASLGYIVRPFLKHIITRQNKTINKNIVSNKQTTAATKTKIEIQIIIRGKRNSHNTPQTGRPYSQECVS